MGEELASSTRHFSRLVIFAVKSFLTCYGWVGQVLLVSMEDMGSMFHGIDTARKSSTIPYVKAEDGAQPLRLHHTAALCLGPPLRLLSSKPLDPDFTSYDS
ncbi:hypothetical protein TIFTF001_003888 [Ficus carica]|uniref:Uncharacterized protein n=1 Tax=Ficus carica TaxID=3494 RepID=A0AA88CV24_FICCA|nr:hypothetical protein TIFTF001_003888 [Ficus carica]